MGKTLSLVLILIITTGATCTSFERKVCDDGKPCITTKASNTSVGWDRKDLGLRLVKGQEKSTLVEISMGESGGSKGLESVISGLEDVLEELNDLKP